MKNDGNDEIDDQLARLKHRNPIVGEHLPPFLRSDNSEIAYAKCMDDDDFMAHLRVNPGSIIANQFDIALEIPVIVSFHHPLQPRVLQQFEQIRRRATVDQDIGILVAKDPQAKRLVRDRQKFAYPILVVLESEIAELRRTSSLRKQFANLLRSVNHFEFSLDIKDPNQFFGREADIQAIMEYLERGQSVGLFGLRKSGKTSLLHQLRVRLPMKGVLSAFLQLNLIQDGVVFRGRILEELASLASAEGKRLPRLDALDRSGRVVNSGVLVRRWTYDAERLLDLIDKPVVIMIDEIDLANDETAINQEFAKDRRQQRYDRFLVLKELRGLVQLRQAKGRPPMTLLVAGVAASIATSAVRFGEENQLLHFLSVRTLGPMHPEELRLMIRTLGKRSGVVFDKGPWLDLLWNEYGGHPHLSRQACSLIAESRMKISGAPVPYHATEEDLTRAFEADGETSPKQAAQQILISFGLWYPNEHKMLSRALREGYSRPLKPYSINHAISFGICTEDGFLQLTSLRRGA
jgi:hypothetical protein